MAQKSQSLSWDDDVNVQTRENEEKTLNVCEEGHVMEEKNCQKSPEASAGSPLKRSMSKLTQFMF